jgi:hypothetical protein
LEAGDTDQVDSLLLNNAAATLNLAGSLALGGPFGLLNVAAGTVLLPGALTGGTLALGTGSTLTDEGGTFTGALNAATGAAINLGGSTLSLSGRGYDRATIAGPGTIATSGIYDVGGLALTGGQTEFISAGLAVQDGATTLDSALLTIANGAAYEINAAGASISTDGAATIINSGLFTKANDDSTNIVTASFTNTSAGVLTVPRGVLELEGGGVLDGVLTGPGELELAGGTYMVAAASSSLGTLAVSNSTVLLGSTQSFAGTVLGNNATLGLGGQNLTLSGTADLTDVSVYGPGSLTLSGSGVLSADDFFSGATLIDAGSFNATGNVVFIAGGAFTVASGADFDFTFVGPYLSAPTIVVAGEIEKTAGLGSNVIIGTVENSGLILDLSGQMLFDGPIANTGLIESTGPADILLSTVTGAGTIAVIDSALTLEGSVSSGQTILFSGTGDVLNLYDAAGMSGIITGFAPGDTIAFNNVSVTPGTYIVSSAGLLTLPVTGGAPITLTFASSADNLPITLTANGGVIEATTAIPVPTTTTEWNGATTDWNSANWSNGIPNAATINAGITTSGAYTVAIAPTESFTVANLLINDSAATLALEGSLTAQSLILESGTLQDSGVFSGALNASDFSTIDLLGANLTVSNNGAIRANITGAGTLAIAGLYDVGGQTLGSGITEQITGIAIQDGTATFAAGDLLTIASNAVYDVNADNFAITSTGPFSILNTGLFTKANDSGTTDVEGAITNTAAGVITVPAGVLDFLQGGIIDGTVNGPGEVLLGAGAFTLATSNYSLGTLAIGTADVILAAAQTLSGDVFTTTGSTIALNGHNLTLSGASSLAGASITGTGLLNITGTGETNLTTFAPGATLLDSGSINQDGAITFAPGANFTIASGADYDITSDSGITSSTTIALNGELEKTAGTNDSTIAAPLSIAITGLILGLSGNLDFTAPITNTGLIESSGPGNITLSTLTGTGRLEMLYSDMTLTGPVAPGQTISFAGTNDILTLTDPTEMQGVITGFGPTDTIVMSGLNFTPGVYTVSGTGLLSLPESNGTTLPLHFAPDDYFYPFTIASESSAAHAITACFAAGTKIRTANGDCNVEHLQPGMRLATAHAGFQPIKWVGVRHYDGRFIAGNRDILPIIIKSNAIADGIPSRDLTVSPGHAICLDGALIHAKRLINGRSIIQLPHVESLSYYHIELATHEIILAENCPAETFMDEQFRNQFQNAATYYHRYPGEHAATHPCLPQLSGFSLAASLHRLETRAGLARPRTPPGPLRGFVDIAGPDICNGWAYDTANPNHPVVLDIFRGEQRIARVLANDYRADLRAAGIGEGTCAFSVPLPPGAAPITVRRATDGAPLTLTDNAAARAA